MARGFTGDALIGQVLGTKYRVESVLGSGGMAIVLAAKHVTLGHSVAIKILKPEVASHPSQAARVLREARAAARLTSENATRVLDIGALDSGEPYIVMEHLMGSDLGRVLAERGPLAVSEAASYLVQACDAVAEAHAMDIVHRDLKPSNLFLTARRNGSPLVKLMDFGISKLVSAEPEESLTGTQDSLGTPHYMSPEQLMTSREVDARSDVWALGVILYRMLTGEYPFAGETTPAVHVAIASAPAPRLRDRLPDAPEPIEALVFDCLVKSRTERLPSARAFAKVLLAYTDVDTQRRYAHLASVESAPAEAVAGSRVDVVTAPDPETHAAWNTQRTTSASGRRSWTVAGASTAAGVVLIGAFWAARRPSEPPAQASAPPAEAVVSAAPSAESSAPAPAVPATAPRPSASVDAVATSAAPMRRQPRPAAPVRPVPAPTPTPTARLDPYGQRH
jgi:serine/threonine protein kinase